MTYVSQAWLLEVKITSMVQKAFFWGLKILMTLTMHTATKTLQMLSVGWKNIVWDIYGPWRESFSFGHGTTEHETAPAHQIWLHKVQQSDKDTGQTPIFWGFKLSLRP